MLRMFPIISMLLLLTACAPTIKTQTIPVSTIPSGADVRVDGKQNLTAPCTVDLTCTQDHILSLSKDGYEAQDVVIKRKYQQQKVLLNALNSGLSTGTLLDSAIMGINSGVSSIEGQESSGEAYVLSPSAVSVRLVPVKGFAADADPADMHRALAHPQSPLALLGPHDEQMLENALESSASGRTVTWTSSGKNTTFAVVCADAHQQGSHLVRSFSLAARLADGSKTVKHYKAYRAGRGEWQVGQPASQSPDDASLHLSAKDVARTLGEVAGSMKLPSWDKSTDLEKSDHTSVHHNSDGSVTTRKSSTRVSAGMHITPQGVLQLLNAL
jgi:surface antigen